MIVLNQWNTIFHKCIVLYEFIYQNILFSFIYMAIKFHITNIYITSCILLHCNGVVIFITCSVEEMLCC